MHTAAAREAMQKKHYRFAPPKGESYQDVELRVAPFVTSLLERALKQANEQKRTSCSFAVSQNCCAYPTAC
jgi:broad specificity phosphatase PhoE